MPPNRIVWPPQKANWPQKIAALQARQDWHKELLGELDAEQKQISVTDPDTRKMPSAARDDCGLQRAGGRGCKAQADCLPRTT